MVSGTNLKQIIISGAKSAGSKCGRDHMKWQPWCPFWGRVTFDSMCGFVFFECKQIANCFRELCSVSVKLF